jgi:hypothetical protein
MNAANWSGVAVMQQGTLRRNRRSLASCAFHVLGRFARLGLPPSAQHVHHRIELPRVPPVTAMPSFQRLTEG